LSVIEPAPHRRIELGNDRCRRAARAHKAVPADHLEAGQARDLGTFKMGACAGR